MRNVRHTAVSPSFLARALNMPDGSEVVGAQWDFMCGVLRLFVAHPSFSETPEGCQVNRVTLMKVEHRREAEPGDWIQTYESKWV